MPELKPVIKRNTLSPSMRVTAFQLIPKEHADWKWHGAGIGDREEGSIETDFLKAMRKVSKSHSSPEPGA